MTLGSGEIQPAVLEQSLAPSGYSRICEVKK